MRFVAVKTEEQQVQGMLFRTWDLLLIVRQRTQTINALRGHLAEYGVTAPHRPAHVGRLAWAVENPDSGLPEPVRELGGLLLAQIAELNVKIAGLETDLNACARQDEGAARLMTIPGIGPVTAMALQAFAPPMEGFQRGRDFSARLGLVPRQHTTGGKPRLGKTPKMGQRDLRRLLITGAMAVVRPAWCDDRSLARQDAGAQTEDADRSGAGQPNGADRLGPDDNEGDLPGSRRRLKRRSAGAVGGCRQDGERVRANGQRDGIGQTSSNRRAFKLAQAIRTRSAYLHTGQRLLTAAPTGRIDDST